MANRSDVPNELSNGDNHHRGPRPASNSAIPKRLAKVNATVNEATFRDVTLGDVIPQSPKLPGFVRPAIKQSASPIAN